MQRRRIIRRGRYNNGVVKGVRFFQRGDNLCDAARFLPDCNIDANGVFALLVDNCVNCNGCFTRLPVAYQKFPLPSSDGEH